MATNIIMPQLGESVVEGTVSKWLKQVGDAVAEFEPLLEVSTDKVDTEIPSPASGVLLEIYVPEGKTVERGVLLAVVGQAGENAAATSAQAETTVHEHTQVVQAQETAVATSMPEEAGSQRYSPVVARMAAEHKIDLSRIAGTGLSGRVTKKDVEAYLANGGQAKTAVTPQLEPWEQPISGDLFKPTEEVFAKANEGKQAEATSAQPQSWAGALANKAKEQQTQTEQDRLRLYGNGEVLPISNMRRLIADHMVQSKLHTAPHVTTVFEIDMTRTWNHWQANMEPYAKQGVKLTLTAYFMLAMVKAVQTQRILNAQWTTQGLFVPHAINIGMAVALTDGLIVPVIRNAQDLNLTGMARQVSDLATRARAKQLKADETSGGTITLTNHGVSGSLLATPIINQPQSAIVGTGAVTKRVVVLPETDSIAIRPMMYATLTFDHRVADGAMADAFMVVFKRTLEEWE
ncbi:MAG: 2-oxo acid dehydrogenase subunit E2 [Anaerolineae bacterium]|nr:2-oxo acid dehydrogenase subunit E2 [Anaerolineae bacterium]